MKSMRLVRLETVLWIVMVAGVVTILMSTPDTLPPHLWTTLSFLLPVATGLLSLLEAAPPTISIKIDTRMTMWLWCLWFMSALAATAIFAIASHVIIYLLFR
jgi:hypothetical protein